MIRYVFYKDENNRARFGLRKNIYLVQEEGTKGQLEEYDLQRCKNMLRLKKVYWE